MRTFGRECFFDLSEDAVCSDRKRAHLNLHQNFDEKVQRLFISLAKGSYVEPHYHALPHQWEMFVVIEGIVEVVFYSPDGSEVHHLLVGEGQDCKVIEIDPLDIHSVECISEKALILEVKEGPFVAKYAKVTAKFSSA